MTMKYLRSKMILLAKIFNSLEMQFKIEFNAKLRIFFEVSQQIDTARFGNLLCEIGLSSRVVL